MNQNFIFFSPFSGSDHVQFEASLINLFILEYKHCSITIVGNNCHLEHLVSLMPKCRIDTIVTTSKIPLFINFFLLIQSLSRQNSTKIHLSCDSTMSYWSYLFSLFMPLNMVFIHGYWRGRRYFLGKFLHLFFLKLFILFHPKVKNILLGEWIFGNIQKDILLSRKEKKSFFWMYHPYMLKYNHILDLGLKPIFGFPGCQDKKFKKVERKDYIDMISYIGALGGKTIYAESFLPVRNEYELIFLKSNFIILLYPPGAYDYRCSGILIESLMFIKPIICLSSCMTDYFFSKFGDIGYNCQNLNSMKETIRVLSSQVDFGRYASQIKNLKNAQNFIGHSRLIFFH